MFSVIVNFVVGYFTLPHNWCSYQRAYQAIDTVLLTGIMCTALYGILSVANLLCAASYFPLNVAGVILASLVALTAGWLIVGILHAVGREVIYDTKVRSIFHS